MQWSGSWVNENETSTLSLADPQRVGFYVRQEKKGISTEVMHLVNMKFEEKKILKVLILLLSNGVKFCPVASGLWKQSSG